MVFVSNLLNNYWPLCLGFPKRNFVIKFKYSTNTCIMATCKVIWLPIEDFHGEALWRTISTLRVLGFFLTVSGRLYFIAEKPPALSEYEKFPPAQPWALTAKSNHLTQLRSPPSVMGPDGPRPPHAGFKSFFVSHLSITYFCEASKVLVHYLSISTSCWRDDGHEKTFSWHFQTLWSPEAATV